MLCCTLEMENRKLNYADELADIYILFDSINHICNQIKGFVWYSGIALDRT